MYSRLQYISQGATVVEQSTNIHRVLDAGCTWIQLRFKNGDTRQLIELAGGLKTLCASYHATFIINDRVDIAKCVDLDGVHLGIQDMPVIHARNILGENKIIGGTANTLEDVLLRTQDGCNYIGLGPFRFTTTKEKLSPVLGLEGYKSIVDKISRDAKIPIYAIGGIVVEDVESLLTTGVYGVAVSGTLTNHTGKKELIRKFNSLLYENVDNR